MSRDYETENWSGASSVLFATRQFNVTFKKVICGGKLISNDFNSIRFVILIFFHNLESDRTFIWRNYKIRVAVYTNNEQNK